MKFESNSGESIELEDSVFGVDFKEPLIHQVIVAYLSGARVGDKGQKTRSEVSGGGRKPWRQKGTGRARAGTIRSPIWVGGGRAFAARPGERNFQKKINRKSYRLAMKSILSELLRQGRLIVTDEVSVDSISTKALRSRLDGLGLGSCLLLSEDVDNNLYLSCRNLINVNVISVDTLDPVSLVQAEKVVATSGAIKRLEQRLAK